MQATKETLQYYLVPLMSTMGSKNPYLNHYCIRAKRYKEKDLCTVYYKVPVHHTFVELL